MQRKDIFKWLRLDALSTHTLRTRTHARAHARTHAHTHTHTHTHTRVLMTPPSAQTLAFVYCWSTVWRHMVSLVVSYPRVRANMCVGLCVSIDVLQSAPSVFYINILFFLFSTTPFCTAYLYSHISVALLELPSFINDQFKRLELCYYCF